MNSPPLLERLGVAYFRRLSQGVRAVDEDGVHVLNARELAALKSIERGAVARAAVAGALSAAAAAVAEVVANQQHGVAEGGALGARGWGLVLGVTAVASVLEIAYLYWDSLRAVHRLSVEAGLTLFADERTEQQAVANALARAALELPNAPRGSYGLDATRDASKLRLVIASLVYKLKTGVSNFLIKALVRRALGRTVLRNYLQAILPFVAVPITALWNGVVAWLVVREARLRVVGPSAANQLCGFALAAGKLSPAGCEVALMAVGCAAVRTGDLHPNMLALLSEVEVRIGDPLTVEIGETRTFLAGLAALEATEAAAVLRLLCVASVIDGKVARSERALLREAFASRGQTLDEGQLEELRERLQRGYPLEAVLVERLAR